MLNIKGIMMKNKYSPLLLVAFLFAIFSITTPGRDSGPAQQLRLQIDPYLDGIASSPKNSDWLLKLVALINDSTDTHLQKEIFYSQDSQSVLTLFPDSDEQLLVINTGKGLESAVAKVGRQASQAAQKFWGTSPSLKLVGTDSSHRVQIRQEDFVEPLVLESPLVAHSVTGVALYRSMPSLNRSLLVFSEPVFNRQAERINKRQSSADKSNGVSLPVEAEFLIALRYGLAIHGFAYQVMLDSIPLHPAPDAIEQTPFTASALAYFKLLAMAADLSRTFTDYTAERIVSIIVELLHIDILRQPDQSAAAYVFWALSQKKWLQASLLTKKLEIDHQALLKQLPEYLNQLENRIIKEKSFSLPARFSFQSLRETLKLIAD